MGVTLRIPNFKILSMRYIKIGLTKDYESQNFSFLAFIGTELVSRQISATAAKRRVTDAPIMLLEHKHIFKNWVLLK
jgi:hypothetical protein